MKRSFSVILGLALVAGLFGALPARAQDVPVVPAEPNVVDPTGDANYVNDQGLNGIIGRDGDHVGPADASTSADLVAAWFTNDASSVSAHILVEGALPSTPSYFYRVLVDPAGGENDCLWFQAGVPGVADAVGGDPVGSIRDICGDGSTIDGEATLAENPDGGTIVTIKIPMGTFGLSPGMVLGSPNATSRNWIRTPGPSATAPQVDNTKPGTPYTVAAGGPVVAPEPEPEPEPEPPGKSDPPGKGKKKGCKKGKGKKKGACPGKKKEGKPETPVDQCPAYVPGEQGAEAETTIVTDAATAEEPVVLEFDAGVGLGGPIIGGVPVPPDQRTHNYHNVQVDTAGAETGLYVKLEFPDRRDYDLYLFHPDGTEATHSGHFNTGVEIPVFACGNASTGCAAGSNFESVNGVRTADCQGYTIDSVSFLSEGGDVTLSMWLGDVAVDPAPAGGGEEEALSVFYRLMRL